MAYRLHPAPAWGFLFSCNSRLSLTPVFLDMLYALLGTSFTSPLPHHPHLILCISVLPDPERRLGFPMKCLRKPCTISCLILVILYTLGVLNYISVTTPSSRRKWDCFVYHMTRIPNTTDRYLACEAW